MAHERGVGRGVDHRRLRSRRAPGEGGTRFFSFDPESMHPFATLVTNNLNDTASDLDRSGVYRLNVGVRKETWVGLFGQPTKSTPGDYGLGSGSAVEWDFTALDILMPHPVYGR